MAERKERSSSVRVALPMDLWLFGATVALVVIGLTLVYDSSYLVGIAKFNDSYYFLRLQALGAVFGFGAAAAVMRAGYWRFRKLGNALLPAAAALLLLVWTALGKEEHGAHRWLRLPISWQPSELAKLALILFLASAFAGAAGGRIRSADLWWRVFVSSVILGLINAEPDLGTAAALFTAVFALIAVAGVRRMELLKIVGGFALLFALASMAHTHRSDRLKAWLHPEQFNQGIGYQSYRARLAVGTGGLVGVGLGSGKEKYTLPEIESDFIFVNIAEETGFLGSALVIGLYMIVGARAYRAARLCKDRFGQLLATGLGTLIMGQAIINLTTVTGVLPATGVPLPFISNGISSLVVMMVSVGLLLSIAQHPTPPMRSRA